MTTRPNNPWREHDTPEIRNGAIARTVLRETMEAIDQLSLAMRADGPLDALDAEAAATLTRAAKEFRAAILAYHCQIFGKVKGM